MNNPVLLHSTTTFYAPLWTSDYKKFISAICADRRYQKTDKSQVPQYLIPYITNIFKDDALYGEFSLGEAYFPGISLFDSCFDQGGSAKLSAVKICCFSTGCLFMEFQIDYHKATLDAIADFSFKFKNANSQDPNHPETTRLIDAIFALIPAGTDTIPFHGASQFKNDCKMFHHIFLEQAPEKAELTRHLTHLRRGYHREFPIPQMDDAFDMMFAPYDYDHWAGSQEGLVNIYHLTDNETTNNYLKKHKSNQLSQNYRFMYLVLLNQRFSAIAFLEKIPKLRSYTRKERDAANLNISSLKTVFSFSIVSDDQLYQSIYSKMYSILGIDRLLEDIRDNEEQMQLLQNNELLAAEKMTSTFLFGLSVLSLFSVLVDAAGFFDRIPILQSASTILSALCLLAIIAVYIVWLIRYQKK